MLSSGWFEKPRSTREYVEHSYKLSHSASGTQVLCTVRATDTPPQRLLPFGEVRTHDEIKTLISRGLHETGPEEGSDGSFVRETMTNRNSTTQCHATKRNHTRER